MPEAADSSNQKDSILIARNTPVAAVIGGAGFLGSHLVEILLKKNIQVLAIDDLSSGFKQYLEEATKDKNFHFLNGDAGSFSLELPRLDYLFVAAEGGWNLANVLELAKQHHPKIVFVSSIELYNESASDTLHWFKESEQKIAQFAADHNLNARVVRLAAVYGPRMHFRAEDGLVELIKATLLGELQKHSLNQQFSTRAIFVDDAVNLIIKSMFAGATALKIFDGALNEPIQLAEIKQVLLDPVWYENRGFKPTELPPWMTPNLEKTIKTLSWQPQSNMVKALKETLNYFKEAEVPVSQIATPVPTHKINLWVDEPVKKSNVTQEGTGWEIKDSVHKSHSWGRQFIGVVLLILIFYALFYPFIAVGIGVLNYKNHLVAASQALEKGDFETSIRLIKTAEESITAANFLISSVQVARQNGWFGEQFGLADDLIKSADLVAQGTKEAAMGTKSLFQILKIVLGQDQAKLTDQLDRAQLQLTSADSHFSQAQAILSSESFKNHLPGILQTRVHNLQDRLDYGHKLASKAYQVANLISSLTAINTKKSYLVVLQDQSELRPTGGLIIGLVKLDFAEGRLKTFTVLNPPDLDKKLTTTVEPPKELKSDLGLKNWNLVNANWEGDFPTSARQIAWFFNQETGQKVDGVVGLDITTLKEILQVIGPVKTAETEITSDNLSTALSASQAGFYPALLTAVFNKLLTPQDLNWPGVLTTLDRSLDSKNMTIYLDETKPLSDLMELGWAGILPRPRAGKGGLRDFLATIEANLGGNKANYFVTENRTLETTISSGGEVEQKLTIDYKNNSQNEVYPAGQYKNNLRLYLPFGSKVNQISWGDTLKSTSNFSDYGRSGVSILVNLGPQESKTLVISYQLPNKLEFVDNQAKYSLNLVKQSGVDYSLKWKLNYPVNWQLLGEKWSTGQQEINLDMKSDQLLSATFVK